MIGERIRFDLKEVRMGLGWLGWRYEKGGADKMNEDADLAEEDLPGARRTSTTKERLWPRMR
jgi:hypothetical protein